MVIFIKLFKGVSQNKLYYYVCIFVVCCVAGWMIEVVFRSLKAERLIVPGFLYGCYLPLYGVGSFLLVVCFGKASQKKVGWLRIDFMPLLILLGSMIVLSVLEYFTHFVLEKMFKTELWSYSAHRFNIQGRVSLKQSLMFGTGGTIFIYFVYPSLKNFVMSIREEVAKIAGVSSIIILSADFILSLEKYLN